jgi:hypothetical protein
MKTRHSCSMHLQTASSNALVHRAALSTCANKLTNGVLGGTRAACSLEKRNSNSEPSNRRKDQALCSGSHACPRKIGAGPWRWAAGVEARVRWLARVWNNYSIPWVLNSAGLYIHTHRVIGYLQAHRYEYTIIAF